MNLGVWFGAAECQRPANNIDPPMQSSYKHCNMWIVSILIHFLSFPENNYKKKEDAQSRASALNAWLKGSLYKRSSSSSTRVFLCVVREDHVVADRSKSPSVLIRLRKAADQSRLLWYAGVKKEVYKIKSMKVKRVGMRKGVGGL